MQVPLPGGPSPHGSETRWGEPLIRPPTFVGLDGHGSGQRRRAVSGSKPNMADAYIQGGSEGSVEFDESAESGAVESRLSVVRTLVEDVAHNGGAPFQQEITVDGGIWRVTVERVK